MSILNPSSEELDALLEVIAAGIPDYALTAHSALVSLRTAVEQKAAAVAVLEKRLRELESYRNSIRSIDLEFDTPTDPAPVAPSSPPRLSLVPWPTEQTP